MDPAIAENVRLTVRFAHSEFHKEADVSIPYSSSLGEALGELLALVSAPPHLRSWQGSTVGGHRIDMTTPLCATELAEGSIVVLGPAHPASVPVIKDAAEALEENAREEQSGSAATLWALCALLGVASLIAVFDPAIAAAGTSALSFLLALWTRNNLLAHFAVGAMALSGWLFAGGGHSLMPIDLALSLLCAVLAAGCVIGLCSLAGLGTARSISALVTCCALGLVAAAGFFLPGPSSTLVGAPVIAASALSVCFLLICLVVTPGITARLAGLKPPRLPTAGQELAISDEPDLDVEDHARRAGKIYEGIALGLACGMVPALLILATTGAAAPGSALSSLVGIDNAGAGFAQALCITVSGSLALHAARQGRTRASQPLMIIAATAGLSACLCAAAGWLRLDGVTPGTGLWVMSAFAIFTILVMLAGAVAIPRISPLEPTAVLWLERSESLAIAASLPLAMHLAGIFFLIRGLG